MQTKEYRTIDKSKWGEGPWQSEPDKIQWQDETTGLPCLIVRGPVGALCGYVGVPEGHAAFEKGYDDIDVSVHGGLTFARPCQVSERLNEEHLVCHVPDPGEPDNVWWLGFDCAHAGDVCPRYREYGISLDIFEHGEYRDLSYVRTECQQLAQQLAIL